MESQYWMEGERVPDECCHWGKICSISCALSVLPAGQSRYSCLQPVHSLELATSCAMSHPAVRVWLEHEKCRRNADWLIWPWGEMERLQEKQCGLWSTRGHRSFAGVQRMLHWVDWKKHTSLNMGLLPSRESYAISLFFFFLVEN